MEINTPERNAYHLLSVLQSYAPTGKEQAILSNTYNKALKEGMSHEELVVMLTRILADGLNYGNWPWSSWMNGPASNEAVKLEAKNSEAAKQWGDVVQYMRTHPLKEKGTEL